MKFKYKYLYNNSLNFKGPSGDPGYEGFLIGTKGEAGDRGNIPSINIYCNVKIGK